MNQLFSITYRPGPHQPPLSLVCQGFKAGDETLLWIDGINLEDPVVVPIGAVSGNTIERLGTYREFCMQRMQVASAVLAESQGEHSPSILARAMLYMESDSRMSAHDALEHAEQQALDLIDADNTAAMLFQQACGAAELAVA